MKQLEIWQINTLSPYMVYQEADVLTFMTDTGIKYAVDFDEDTNPFFKAYWLNLTNLSALPSPGDPKIPQTIICIIEEFFRQNPDILLYMCSTDGGQQAQRARLFLRWFNGAEQQKHYVARSVEVRGEGNRKEYVALIVQRNNPQLEEILAVFEQEISTFNEQKPAD
ncbi:MAG: hypothetical protein IJQ59_03360 [Bacteroidaceae bacterium]|nr:hypothetical protein [Bacteroidaceae bacterium]